jgi:hypothetical protein
VGVLVSEVRGGKGGEGETNITDFILLAIDLEIEISNRVFRTRDTDRPVTNFSSNSLYVVGTCPFAFISIVVAVIYGLPTAGRCWVVLEVFAGSGRVFDGFPAAGGSWVRLEIFACSWWVFDRFPAADGGVVDWNGGGEGNESGEGGELSEFHFGWFDVVSYSWICKVEMQLWN